MSGTVKIYGQTQFGGDDQGVQNFAFEELAADPTTHLTVGRAWLNTTEGNVKVVASLDTSGNPVIKTLMWA